MGWKVWLSFVLLLGVAAAVGVYNMVSVPANVGAAAIAKVVCSCIFVDHRSEASCREDDPPGFESVLAEVDLENAKVTGSVMGVFTDTASYNEATGCTLLP